MGTIADKLNLLLKTKNEIRSALIAQGQDMPDNLPFSEYSEKVRAIPVGGNDVTLHQLPEGTVILLPENGVATWFYILKHDYEPELNGYGRTLMMRKDSYVKQTWNATLVNTYASSSVDAWLNGEYKTLLDADLQQKIGTTKFYYTPMGGDIEVSILERSVFLVSVTETGLTEPTPYYNTEGSTIPVLTSIHLSTFINNTGASGYWTRSPYVEDTKHVYIVNTNSKGLYCSNASVSSASYVPRPCFTLPSDYAIPNISSKMVFQAVIADSDEAIEIV